MYAYLDLFWEGGTEHHGLASTFRRHSVLLHDTSDLGFKTHIEHSVCLVQNQVSTQNVWSHFSEGQRKPSIFLQLDSHTCSSLGQSCPAPSCLPDDPVWPLAGDSLFLNHGSAALYLRLRTPHMGALWNGMRTAEDDNKMS